MVNQRQAAACSANLSSNSHPTEVFSVRLQSLVDSRSVHPQLRPASSRLRLVVSLVRAITRHQAPADCSAGSRIRISSSRNLNNRREDFLARRISQEHRVDCLAVVNQVRRGVVEDSLARRLNNNSRSNRRAQGCLDQHNSSSSNSRQEVSSAAQRNNSRLSVVAAACLAQHSKHQAEVFLGRHSKVRSGKLFVPVFLRAGEVIYR